MLGIKLSEYLALFWLYYLSTILIITKLKVSQSNKFNPIFRSRTQWDLDTLVFFWYLCTADYQQSMWKSNSKWGNFKGETKLTSPWDPSNLCYPQGFYSNSHSTHWPSLISSSSSGQHLETMSVVSPPAHLVRVWYLLESQSLSSRPLVFADLTICTRMGVNSPCRDYVIRCGDSTFWRQQYTPDNSHFVQKFSWNGGYHIHGPKAFDLVSEFVQPTESSDSHSDLFVLVASLKRRLTDDRSAVSCFCRAIKRQICGRHCRRTRLTPRYIEESPSVL